MPRSQISLSLLLVIKGVETLLCLQYMQYGPAYVRALVTCLARSDVGEANCAVTHLAEGGHQAPPLCLALSTMIGPVGYPTKRTVSTPPSFPSPPLPPHPPTHMEGEEDQVDVVQSVLVPRKERLPAMTGECDLGYIQAPPPHALSNTRRYVYFSTWFRRLQARV